MALLDVLSFLRTEYKPAPGEFLPIDMVKLAEKMRLRELGAGRGRQNLPAVSSGTFDEIERQITEGIRAYALAEEKRTHEQLTLYEQRLQSADPHGAAADMRAAAIASIGQFEAEWLPAKSELEQARRDLIERREAVHAFREANRLDRPVNPATNHAWLGGILAVLFLIETAPNAILFSAGDELGVIGGYAIAVVFSFLNLAFGFMAGHWGCTNALHVRHHRKIVGIAFTLTMVVAVVALNLLVAHYRELVGGGASTAEAARQSWTAVMSHPFTLSDSLSVGLAAMGGLFSIVALAEGFLWQDPYPGYSAVTHNLLMSERQWTRLLEERLSLLDNVQQHHADQLRAARSSLRDRRAAIPEILGARARLVRNFELHIQHLEGVGRYALSVYRDANRAARSSDHAAPPHFDSEWHLNGISVTDPAAMPIPMAETEWQVANDALEASMEKLQQKFRDAVAAVEKLASHEALNRPSPVGSG